MTSLKRRFWNPFQRVIRRALPLSVSTSALQSGLAPGARGQAAMVVRCHHQQAAPRQRSRNEWLLLGFIALPHAGLAIWQSRPNLTLKKYIRLDERRTE